MRSIGCKDKFNDIRLLLLGFDPGFMRLYYKFLYQPKTGSIAGIIEQKAKNIQDFHFLQIGGNDGFVNDPIFKFVKRFSWKGIIVEPQKEVFTKRLCKTYRFAKNVVLENLAIAEETCTRKLYKIAISNSRWATGLATFDRRILEFQIARNYISDCAKKEGVALPTNMDSYISFEEVHCTTIADLLIKHNFQNLDLLQIDTEGFDFELIKTIDFSTLKPTMISFENEHLSKSDFIKCEDLLRANGYLVNHIGRDSIAYFENNMS